MMIFTSGFAGGWVLWILFPSTTPYQSLKYPFFVSLALFFVHRIEEKQMEFFKRLSEITNVETPDILSWQIILLVAMSVGGWLSIPFLLKRKKEFGYYLIWTFFAAMGITELAHFLVFPFLIDEPYGYFSGMASVTFLAPVAWWGMWRLKNGKGGRSSDQSHI